jgi:hypothetical protein
VVADIIETVTSTPGRVFARYGGDCQAVGGAPAVLAEGVLADPIDLLDWISSQRSASRLHGGIQAYLYSSDPDLLLGRPVSHPDPDPPPDAPAEPVVVTVATGYFVEERDEEVAGTERPGSSVIDFGDRGRLVIDVAAAGDAD